jgi:hypothetical protein
MKVINKYQTLLRPINIFNTLNELKYMSHDYSLLK